MQHDTAPSIAKLCKAVIDGRSSCHEAMLLIVTLEKVAQRLGEKDREVLAVALKTTASNLLHHDQEVCARWN
jgi:hypothetical protein